MANRHILGGQFHMGPGDRSFDDKMDMKINDMVSLKRTVTTPAETPEEKFRVLDARDKLYKIFRDKDPIAKRDALVATCPDMCPEKERYLRECQGLGSVFEMTSFSKNSSFNHALAIKEYARSSADQEEPLPHDLRPVSVLTMTMNHLLHNVVDFCELSDENLEEWYMFMWSRTRALRKELTQQGVCNLESVKLVEQCARFHIHCAERLADQDTSIYDDKINTENLTKSLQTLKYMYKDLAKEDVECPNQPEFTCYTLLLNLNNSSFFTELSNMSASLMASAPVKFALDVMTTWETRNYIRFFNLVKKASYLNSCLLRRYFGEMRLYAIKTMIRSYCTKNYSPQIIISRFIEILNFEGERECYTFLSQCNFNFQKTGNGTVVNFDRGLFQNPSSTLTSGRAYLFIEEKKKNPLSVIMAGGYLPPNNFANHHPQNSFTIRGDLKTEALLSNELIDFVILSSPTKPAQFEPKPNLNRIIPQIIVDVPKVGELNRDQKKDEKLRQNSLFSVKEKPSNASHIFGSVSSSLFSKSACSNIFKSNFQSSGSFFEPPSENSLSNNIFGNKSSSLFSNINSKIFTSGVNSFAAFSFSSVESIMKPNSESEKSETESVPLYKGIGHFPGFQLKTVKELKEDEKRMKDEREKAELLEKERLLKEKEEEEKMKQIEQEEKDRKAQMIMEQKRLEEEEKERKRKEKEAEKELLKKRELERLRKEEIIRKQTEAMEERVKKADEELKLQEENKRKTEMEHKRKIDNKMSHLKRKVQEWKNKMIFEKWRMKTWTRIEERKMGEYFKEVKLKYPPVCTEKDLDGNPYGLIIPSVLTFEKFQNWRKEFNLEKTKKLLIVSDVLPLLKVNSIVGKALEDRSRNLCSKLDPYPFKLIISVPDESESPDYWKSIETFIEMHFVEHFRWQFGIEKGPLYCRRGCHGTFRFNVSIRRLRGMKLYEGSEPNPSATTGSNALVFVMTESGNDITKERLKTVIKSRSPQPKIPVIIFVLNNQSEDVVDLEKLELDKLKKSHVSESHVVPVVSGKHQLVPQLIKCLQLTVIHSSFPPSVRISQLSSFFKGSWLDTVWRRIEIGLSDFKVILTEPKVLIEFYNSCVDELVSIFLYSNYDDQTILAEEFSECGSVRPSITQTYKENLESVMRRIKLPQWPVETPKSCHQLNYRIHQYCKKIVGQDRVKLKNIKWVCYRIIRRSLLWKGLDIYCDEDISTILFNFPWIQVFQEISRILSRQICEELEKTKNIPVIYDLEGMEQFTFESSLISRLLNKTKRKSPKKAGAHFGEEPLEDYVPCVERDSIVYAHSTAIERESSKRKHEDHINESLDAFFSSPHAKRLVLDEEDESKGKEYLEIENNFQDLSDRLDKIQKMMAENASLLLDVKNNMEISEE